MSKISPCLWYADEAEEAAKLYVSLLPDAHIDTVQRSPADNPSSKEGSVLVVEFILAGQSFQAINGGSAAQYTHALSLSISCEDQAEVDKLWDGLLANGGQAQRCGWLSDRWGVNWQIVPKALPRLLADPDKDRARRAMQAMLQMVKLDVAALEAAADGA